MHDTAAVYGDVLTEGNARVLDRTIARGVTWTVGVKAATVAISWACTIALARILNPQDYGIVTMATVYVGLISMITDFGLGSAVIALPELSEAMAAQLHTTAALVGGVAFVISCGAALPLAFFFKTPALAPVIVALSVLLISDSLRLVPLALLGREMRLKDLALFDGGKVLIALPFALPLALAGLGYWALVAGNIAASIVVTLIVLKKRWQKFGVPRFAELRGTLLYSSNFLANQLAWYGYTNSDFIAAGRVLGKTALGEYTLAWTIVCAPGDKIMAVFGRVMPMVFANVQKDVQALSRYYLKFTEVLAILTVPAAIGLALVSRDFVLLVFGAKWASAVAPLQILCIYLVFHILATPVDRVLLAAQQASYAARCGLLMVAVLPISFYFAGRHWGTTGIAVMWIAIYPLLLVPMYVRAFRVMHLRLRRYVATLVPTAIATVAMVMAVWSIQTLTMPLSAPVHLIAQILCGATAFVLTLLVIERRRLGELAEFVRSIRN